MKKLKKQAILTFKLDNLRYFLTYRNVKHQKLVALSNKVD